MIPTFPVESLAIWEVSRRILVALRVVWMTLPRMALGILATLFRSTITPSNQAG